MKRFHLFLACCILTTLITGRANAQWTQFRGPNGSGVDGASGYPSELSPKANVAWKMSIPYAQSSPIVVGDRLFLTAGEGERLITFCLDARTGRELWRREVKRDRVQVAYKANDPASPTPAADTSGVVSFFPEFGLVSYDNDGKQRWTHRLGPFKNFYGMAGSPIIEGDTVALVCDQQSGSYVIALDRSNGTLRWKKDRPGQSIGWSTPIVFRPEKGRNDLIVLGTSSLDAYDLASGAHRWWLPIGSSGALGTPLVDGDTIMISTLGSNESVLPTFASVLAKYDKNSDGRLSHEEFRADPDMGEHFGWVDVNDDKIIEAAEWNTTREYGLGEWGAIAVRPGNSTGKLEPSAVRWRFQKNIPYIPVPLLYRGVFYMVKAGGIVTSLDPATGKLIKQGRSSGAIGDYFASPVAADGKIFIASNEGKVTVLKAGAEWEVLSVGDLGEEISATPALDNGRVFVRTRGSIFCFNGRK